MWRGRGISWSGAWQVGSSRRLAASLGLIALLAAAVPAPLRAAPPTLVVTMDKALILKYPATTETIVVGNPVIADVTMVRNSGVVILTGKGYGETNLVFLNAAGTLLSESNLRVRPAAATLTVQRGMDRQTYACDPRCQPTIALGDESGYLKGVASDITARNGAAQPSSGSGQSGGMQSPH